MPSDRKLRVRSTPADCIRPAKPCFQPRDWPSPLPGASSTSIRLGFLRVVHGHGKPLGFGPGCGLGSDVCRLLRSHVALRGRREDLRGRNVHPLPARAGWKTAATTGVERTFNPTARVVCQSGRVLPVDGGRGGAPSPREASGPAGSNRCAGRPRTGQPADSAPPRLGRPCLLRSASLRRWSLSVRSIGYHCTRRLRNPANRIQGAPHPPSVPT